MVVIVIIAILMIIVMPIMIKTIWMITKTKIVVMIMIR